MIESLVLMTALVLGGDEVSRPNVVLIVGDDMGWGDFSFMGSRDVATPNIDRLAANGAAFPNGYVPSSLCRASLATLLTGRYGHEHKICCNDPPDGIDRTSMHPFIRSVPTIPRLLGEAGIPSFQTGKYWEGHYSNAGFTEGMSLGGRHGDAGLVIGRKTMQPIADFIDRQGEKPFFLWYAPMLPHQPHDPPKRLLAKYSVSGRDAHLAKYYAMCEWFDETVGELIGILEKRGLLSSTLVVFAVDNGWIQATGGKPNEHLAFAPKSKRSPYDGGLRTPILFHWPGKIPAARRQELVSTIDIAPTILAACDVEIPAALPGRNLLHLICDGKPLGRDAVFGETFLHTCVDLDRPAVNLTHRWVREGKWKLIVPADSKESLELYDIETDPTEEKNSAASEPAVVERLKRRLETWWREMHGESSLSR
jgi:arylsulfatase A-like enzyme